MADIKRKMLLLSSGKQIKLTGTGLAIAKNLNVSEGYVPYVFSCAEEQKENNIGSIILNPHKLTADEIYDMADYNIQLWMDLKTNIRKYGPNDPRIFSADSANYQSANTNDDPESPKKKRLKQAD
jgi:hypothetical protein